MKFGMQSHFPLLMPVTQRPRRAATRAVVQAEQASVVTMEALPPEMRLHVLRYVAKQPSYRGLCRMECVSRTWRDLAKQHEAELWQLVLARRIGQQSALEDLGVGPRRQVKLLANKYVQQRITTQQLESEYDFRMELKVGDAAPSVATTMKLKDGWFDAGPYMHGWDVGLEFEAHFPDVDLQKRPVNTGLPFNWNFATTVPQPIDEPCKLRIIVKRRSDSMVAILLTTDLDLKQWVTAGLHGFFAEGEEDEEVTCIQTNDNHILTSAPPWTFTPNIAPLWNGRVFLEARMWWAGRVGNWNAPSMHKLVITDLCQVYRPHPHAFGEQCRHEYMRLADLDAILKAPECAGNALRWV